MSNISVIVPIYHGENYIPDIIQQIEACKEYMKAKHYVEVLFVNDSPDTPLNCRWKSESVDIKILNSNSNVGIQRARLKGLSFSKGEYILFLDQDDKIKPEYFESQMQNIGVDDAVVCRAIIGKNYKYDEYLPFESAVCKKYMLSQGNGIASPGQVLIRKEAISAVWKKNSLFYNGADDWMLWICMMSEKKVFVLNDEVLYEHVIDGRNASGNLLEMTYSEHEVVNVLEKEDVLSRDELKLLQETVSRICQERICIMDKSMRMSFLCSVWMRLCHDSCSISAYLKKQRYKTVAIYGDGYFGKQLYKELKKDHINVVCFIDRNADYLKEEIPVYKPEKNFPVTDVIIITIIQQGKEVKKSLAELSFAKILCLEDLLEAVR